MMGGSRGYEPMRGRSSPCRYYDDITTLKACRAGFFVLPAATVASKHQLGHAAINAGPLNTVIQHRACVSSSQCASGPSLARLTSLASLARLPQRSLPAVMSQRSIRKMV